jgi:hypothetical protein
MSASLYGTVCESDNVQFFRLTPRSEQVGRIHVGFQTAL